MTGVRDGARAARQRLGAALEPVRRRLRPVLERVAPVARRVAPPRVRRAIAVAVVALAGAYLGLLLGGSVTAPVGPVEARLDLRPSLTGNTVIDVAPLGSLELDTTDAPLGMDASVQSIRVEVVRQLLEHPSTVEDLQTEIVSDVRGAIVKLAVRSLVASVLGALVLTTAVFRRRRTTVQGGLVGLGVVLVAYAVAAATWNPTSLEQPRYTGLLASAPRVVGSAETLATNLNRYGSLLARLVTNVSRLYGVASSLPTDDVGKNTIHVLHVSDLHLNPTGWDVIRSIDQQFGTDVIVDTGDLTERGTAPENRFVDEIGTLGKPYVFVKGNHDSYATARRVDRQPNAVVLDGTKTTAGGVRFWGAADPRYTPDKLVRVSGQENRVMSTYGLQLRPRLEAAEPVDVAITHDPEAAREWDGLAPLLLAGHLHARSTDVLPGGSRLMVGGSTGGAGLRALDHGAPTPIELDMLYLDKKTKRLKAWDEITVGGLSQQSVQIDRHVEKDPSRALDRAIGDSPSPSDPPTPSGSASPFTLPPSTPVSTPARTGRRRRSSHR